MKPYFKKQTPLTIAMWDFSWLNAHHPGGAFYDLERCVIEAAERGYSTQANNTPSKRSFA